MTRSSDRSSDPSPFAWLMAGAVAALGLGSVLASRRRRRAEDQLWAAAEAEVTRPGQGDDEVAGHPS